MNKYGYLFRKFCSMALDGRFVEIGRDAKKFVKQKINRNLLEIRYRRSAERWLMNSNLERNEEVVYAHVKNAPGGIFNPMQNDEEFLNLLRLVFAEKTKTANVMEIGTYNGGALFCFTRMAEPGGVIISVDLPGGFFGGGCSKWKTDLFQLFTDKNQRMITIRDDSHNTAVLERIRSELGDKKIDFLFIDGDHTYEGVKKDFEMYSPLVSSGGYVAFHDIIPESSAIAGVNVKPLWDEIKDKYKSWEFVQSGTIGIGVVQVPSEYRDGSAAF